MVWTAYAVGTNNISDRGDQKKLFVSKSTLIFANKTWAIRFNNMNNVIIYLEPNVWYEFKSNIQQVFHEPVMGVIADDYIRFYFEGVLPDEARRPE